MRLWDGLKIIDALLFLFLLRLFLFFLLFLHSFSVSLLYGSSSYSHLSLSEISGIIPPDPSFLTQPVPAPNSSLSFILFRLDFFSYFFLSSCNPSRAHHRFISHREENWVWYSFVLSSQKTIMILWVLVCVVFFELETTGTLSFSSFFLSLSLSRSSF